MGSHVFSVGTTSNVTTDDTLTSTWRNPALEIVSGLSCLGSLAVIVSYLQFAHFRRHPSAIVLILCICDLLYNLDLFFVGLSFYFTGKTRLEGRACEFDAIWSHFWSSATVNWYAVISVNVLLNLHNPFKSTISYMKFYHAGVWSLAAVTSIILFVFRSHLGPVTDGSCGVARADDPLRWIFYAPLLVYFILGFITLFYALRHMPNLSNQTLYKASQRRTMMTRLILVVLIFTVFWTIPVVNGTIQYVKKSKVEDKIPILWIADLLSVRIQGFANALVWLTNPVLLYKLRNRLRCSRHKYYDAETEIKPILSPGKKKSTHSGSSGKYSDFHHLDDALRKDIISCILMGVRESVLGNTKDSSKYIGTKEFPELLDTDIKMADNSKEDASEFRFFDYSPALFAGIREIDGISNSQYLRSLDPELFLAGANLGVSAGQSGSFFCFSPDRRFILKTVFPEEAKFLANISVSLYQHFLQHKGSLIAKFYGFHGVQVPYGDVIYMVVMANVFDTPRKINQTYDIKGSWVGRRAADRDPPSSILLDLDLKRELKVASDLRLSFLQWMSLDVDFLKGLGIIDYSLLLGFHTLPRSSEETLAPENIMSLSWQKGILSDDGTEIYFAGIIDILQVYNFRKRIERFVKSSLCCNDMRGISVAPPRSYGDRFVLKMGSIFHYDKSPAAIVH